MILHPCGNFNSKNGVNRLFDNRLKSWLECYRKMSKSFGQKRILIKRGLLIKKLFTAVCREPGDCQKAGKGMRKLHRKTK